MQWDQDAVRLGGKTYGAPAIYVPVLIYPNPLNPKRYVVLNSGFTFREYDYVNNARQVPKLPDFAVLDVDVPVSARAAGGIVAAGFFTEECGATGPLNDRRHGRLSRSQCYSPAGPPSRSVTGPAVAVVEGFRVIFYDMKHPLREFANALFMLSWGSCGRPA